MYNDFMQLGFIGHGKHAQNNLYPSLKYLKVPIHAIATTSEETAQKAKDTQASARAYADYKQMIEKEKLEAVLISTPESIHPQIVMDCIASGLHVFVEKPLGMTLLEAHTINELSQKSGRFVMVGFMKRYAPAYRKIKELLKEIGQVTSIEATFGCRSFSATPAEFLLQAAIHSINMVQSFAGELLTISTVTKGVNKTFTIFSTAECENDVVVSLNLIASDSWSKLNEELIITGTDGFIKYNNNTGLSYHKNDYDASGLPRWQIIDEVTTHYSSVSTTSSGGYQDLFQKGFIPEMEHFLECAKLNKQPLTDSADNLKTMIWVSKILKTTV